MKNLTSFFVLIFALTFLSECRQKEENVPDAFQEKSVIDDVSYVKRGYSDLITQLYSEILEKNKDLQALEDSIKKIRKTSSENTEDANKFFENNQKYYNAAYQRIEIIQDSILREKIFKELSENENSFNEKTKKLTKLLAEISQKQAELNDYYTSLKILLTMKQNEKYQNDNLPDTTAVSNLKGKYEDIIKLIKEKIKE